MLEAEEAGGACTGIAPPATATYPLSTAVPPEAAAAAKKAADKAAAAAAGENAGPKSAEVLAWEQKVAEQGQVVRELKAREKTAEAEKEIAGAVEELKRLKAELAELSKKQVEPSA